MEANKNGAYKAMLVITSDGEDEGPYHLDMTFDPPYAEAVEKLGFAPVSYQFMGKILDEAILPVMVFNERYEAEFLDEDGNLKETSIN
jgi:hypothetical protein